MNPALQFPLESLTNKLGVRVHFLSKFGYVRLIYLLDYRHGAKYSIGI